jgi:acetyltransferase
MTKRLLSPTTDRTSDILGIGHDPLQPVFAPRSVAVIGASDRPGSVGRTLLRNLIKSPFGGTVYPVNPRTRACSASGPIPMSAASPNQRIWR